MNKHLQSLVVCALILPSSIAWADGVKVILSPSEQVVRRGETPRFVVEARAVGAPLRIMRFTVRSDLRVNYARIRVTRNGKEVDVPVVISDPGPTSDSDYELLGPNQSISFEHRGEPFVLAELPPGNYSATVTLWPDWRAASVASNAVSFRVIPK